MSIIVHRFYDVMIGLGGADSSLFDYKIQQKPCGEFYDHKKCERQSSNLESDVVLSPYVGSLLRL